jgi:hypothetical protein
MPELAVPYHVLKRKMPQPAPPRQDTAAESSAGASVTF